MINTLIPGRRFFLSTSVEVTWLTASSYGRCGDPNVCLRTVLQYWKNTTAGLDRKGQLVDSKIIASPRNENSKGVGVVEDKM